MGEAGVAGWTEILNPSGTDGVHEDKPVEPASQI